MIVIDEVIRSNNGTGTWYLCQHMKGNKAVHYFYLQSTSCLIAFGDKDPYFDRYKKRAVRKLKDSEISLLTRKEEKRMIAKTVKVTIYISNIETLEELLNVIEKITKTHPYAEINIEVGKN